MIDGQRQTARPPQRQGRLRRALLWSPIPVLLGAALWVLASSPGAAGGAPLRLAALGALLTAALSTLAAAWLGSREPGPPGAPLEEVLRDSEERVQALFSSSSEALFFSEAGRILGANPAACALFGAAEQDLCGRPRASLFDSDDPRAAAVLARPPSADRAAVRFVRADGARFEGEIRSAALARGRALDFVRDAAEREALLSEVQRHAAQIDAVFDSTEEALLVCDETGRIARANPAFHRTFGAPCDGAQAPRLESAEGEPLAAGQWPGARALRGEVVRGMVLRAHPPCGPAGWFSVTAVPILAGGKLSGAAVSFTDVTESRLAEHALRESEERLAVVLRASGGGYCEHAADRGAGNQSPGDPSQELTTSGGPAGMPLRGASSRWFAKVLGYDSEDLPDMPGCIAWFAGQLHPDDRSRFEARYGDFLSGKQAVFEEEVRARRKDGTWCYIRATGAAVQRDEQGRPSYVAGLLFDIDARKRAELDREQLVAALREADRRKDEYLAMLGHELRNPLAPIRNSLYVLERAPPGAEQAKRALSIIDRQVNHLVRLVDDLLDASRAAHGAIQLNPEPLGLCDLVRRAADDHRSIFTEAGLELRVDTPPEEVRVRGDRMRLSQVVGNLLQNAAKFTPRGGTVTASAGRDPGGRGIVRVRDTGSGIPQEILPRLFEPFTQAETSLDRSKGGLGLGLSLVRRLVELHGGTVAALSMGPGLGTMFEVALPLHAEAGPAPEGDQPAPSPRWGEPRRVLVIEDNPEAASSLRAVLQLMKHAVEVASTGPDGIQKAKGFRPDVVLCDIGLPGMDGYDVARALRADPELTRTPLVALTGYADPEDIAKCTRAGFDHHMAKPPSVQALSQLLARVGPPLSR